MTNNPEKKRNHWGGKYYFHDIMYVIFFFLIWSIMLIRIYSRINHCSMFCKSLRKTVSENWNMKHLPFVEFFLTNAVCFSKLVKWYSAPNNHNCFLLFVVILMSITNTSGFYLSRLNCTPKASGLSKNTCYYCDCYTNTKQPLMEEIMEPAHQHLPLSPR